MAEYIEREAAIYAVLGITICNPMVRQYADAVLFNLNKLPAADVAPVRRGRWVDPRPESEMCSQCGTRFYISALFAVGGNDEPPYCPACGAKMLEEKDGDGDG